MYLRIGALILALLAAFGAGRWSGDSRPVVSGKVADGPVRISPIQPAAPALVTVAEWDTAVVPLLFENTSDSPIRYARHHSGKGVAELEVIILKNGKRVPGSTSRITPEIPAPTKEQVRELDPGEGIVHPFRLSWYSRLAPGRYELSVRYKVEPDSGFVTELGLTPLSLEQIVLLDVRDE